MEETKQILIAITELQTNMRNMSAKIDEISKISNTVLETDQRAKSAHNRIDDLKTDILDKLQTQKQDYEAKFAEQEKRAEKAEANVVFLKRAFIGSTITFVFGVALILIEWGIRR